MNTPEDRITLIDDLASFPELTDDGIDHRGERGRRWCRCGHAS
jgi:hypothetical protein